MTALPKFSVEPNRREDADTGKGVGMKPASRMEPLAISAKQLAELLSISLRSVRAWDCSGRLPKAVVMGGCKRWRLDEIRAWLSAGAPCREEWEARKKGDKAWHQ